MDFPIGTILPYAGQSLPEDWAYAHGQWLAIADHPELFAVIGTTYGGDGITGFRLPDLRGRRWVGAGQGPDTATHDPGAGSGRARHRLSTGQMPRHHHGLDIAGLSPRLPFGTAPGTTDLPGPDSLPADGSFVQTNAPGAPTRPAALWVDPALADTALANADITGTAHAGLSGSAAPIDLSPPYLALEVLIRIRAA